MHFAENSRACVHEGTLRNLWQTQQVNCAACFKHRQSVVAGSHVNACHGIADCNQER